MTDRLRTLIVEDVALARGALLRLLGAHPDVQVSAIAASLGEARALVAQGVFDLALLDVRLPDGSGVDLAREWPGERPPIVFITASPEHAVDAFALHAEDYLLKPITAQGLERALTRVRKRRRAGAGEGEGDGEAEGEGEGREAAARPIAIRDGGRTVWLDPQLIDYVDAAGHYLCLHAGREVHLLRRSMSELLDQLGPGFLRIHRSAAVRVEAVRSLAERRNGDADIQLVGGATLRVSRSFRDAFDARMARRGVTEGA